MATHEIEIDWEGPFTFEEAIENKNDGGKKPKWDGEDYGLYQIYGKHQFYGSNALLYVGMVTEETFSDRFRQHKKWLKLEKDIKVYLGKVYNQNRHTEADDWKLWKWDIDKAESIILYKYQPNYNSDKLSEQPSLLPYKKIKLLHKGRKNRLDEEDNAPEDFKW